MPRVRSRLTLEITEIRVQRLQEISEVDAIAEGIERLPDPVSGSWSGPNRYTLRRMPPDGLSSWNAPTAVDLYRRLFESINGPGSWDANPWAWVLTYKAAPNG